MIKYFRKINKKRGKSQKGGKVLGQGTFGCVIDSLTGNKDVDIPHEAHQNRTNKSTGNNHDVVDDDYRHKPKPHRRGGGAKTHQYRHEQ